MAGPQAKLWTTGYFQQRDIKVAGWTDLALASYLGLTFVVDDILTQEVVDVNTQGGDFGNALQAASLQGHEKVVELLLGKGADVNVQGGSYGNALYAASLQGHKKVVELLLGKGPCCNIQAI
jgi:ankyrin repeat protein